ncbi:zinc metalloprotease HtpX [Accumulibacter sp.]|uniref:zinc metalloprotease HtpX n=1 Tax=Accumulibacter sp. TaxID=2053492 RepID=UPI002618902E|nr:zinc metalloprotease HtpX [Accumulibacter sp.]
MTQRIWQRQVWRNRLQTVLLLLALLGISGLSGALLFGDEGMWVALAAGLLALLLEPATGARLTLALYRARPIADYQAPELAVINRRLADIAGLPRPPQLHYVPSRLVNAFAVGRRDRSAVAMTDGLLRTLSRREVAGVLAHEIAHIASGDLRVMNLADYISRLTSLFAVVGQILLLLSLPLILTGSAEVNLFALLMLVASPHLALLAQLGLSRVREFNADLEAVRLTGDPAGLASALAKIGQVHYSWRRWLLPGWGNPEPSWLRTHPATEERISRLLSLSDARVGWLSWQEAPPFTSQVQPTRRTPRWHPGGYWY